LEQQLWQISSVAQAGWAKWNCNRCDCEESILKDLVIVLELMFMKDMCTFSDWRTNTISKVDKWNGGNVSVIERVATQPFSLKIVHRSKQKMQLKNMCDGVECNGICLNNGKNKASCKCTNLQTTTDDGCVDIHQTLLIATKNGVRGLSTLPPHGHAFPLVSGKQFENIRAVGSFNNRLQILDEASIQVSLVNLTGEADEQILAAGSDIYGVSGMAIDPVIGNTYLTMSSEGVGRIEVFSLDGKKRKVLMESTPSSGIKQPKDIVFMNSTKKLYWFEVSTTPPSIYTMMASGGGMKKLKVNSTLLNKVYNPSVDQFNSKIYWISQGKVVQFNPETEEIQEIDVPGGDGNVSSIAVDMLNGDILIGEFVRIAKSDNSSILTTELALEVCSFERYLL
ncbi:hypothetical protein CAEBREN_28545, partial [Caenorhabditis brenneri]